MLPIGECRRLSASRKIVLSVRANGVHDDDVTAVKRGLES